MPSGAALRSLYRIMKDRTSVTFRDQTALGTYTDIAVDDAWRRPSELSEGAPSLGVYTKAMEDWLFPQSMLSASQYPTPGDIVRWTNTRTSVVENWTVLSVAEVGALGAFRLSCIELALQNGLRGTCTISRPDNTKDAAGRMALTSYSTVAASVPCRIQPTDSSPADVFERRTTPDLSTVYLGYTVDIRAKDRLTDDASQVWTVLETRAPNRLDEMFSADLERVL